MDLIANSNVKHGGKWFKPGAALTVDDEKAAQALIDDGSARKAGEKEPEDQRPRGENGELLTGEQVQALKNAEAEAAGLAGVEQGSGDGTEGANGPGDGTDAEGTTRRRRAR